MTTRGWFTALLILLQSLVKCTVTNPTLQDHIGKEITVHRTTLCTFTLHCQPKCLEELLKQITIEFMSYSSVFMEKTLKILGKRFPFAIQTSAWCTNLWCMISLVTYESNIYKPESVWLQNELPLQLCTIFLNIRNTPF